MNQFCQATMLSRTTLGTHIPRISAQTVTHRLREIGKRPPYTMYVLYAAILFWPSIYSRRNTKITIYIIKQFIMLDVATEII